MYDYAYYDYGSVLDGIWESLAMFLMIFLVIFLAVYIVFIVAQWKLFKKAGKGGWEAIVPFYNNYVMVEIAGLKWYWFLGFFAPVVFDSIYGLEFLGSLVYLFTIFNIFYNLSKKFNKGIGFVICATLFTPICVPILGFSSKAKYDSSIPVSPNVVFGKPESQNVNSNASVQQEQPQSKQESNDSALEQTMDEQQKKETINPSSSQFCINCGSEIIPNAKFCQNCGKQL